ncbi:MAG TPA: CarD family transcriptional regulator [Tepiditoga sp.]|nr:CarD family transcriptional regulator [Tepiditoga sp.]
MDLKNFIEETDKNKINIILVPEYDRIEYEGVNLFNYPDFDVFPFEEYDISSSIKKERLNVINKIIKKEKINIISTLHAITRYTLPENFFKSRIYSVGDKFDIDFYKIGYKIKNETTLCGEFSKRGYIRDFFSPEYDFPVRIELFDDEIERISFFDPYTQRSIKNLNSVSVIPGSEIIKNTETVNIFNERTEKFYNQFGNSEYFDIDNFNSIPGFFYGKKFAFIDFIKNNADIYAVNPEKILKTFSEKERENLEICDTDLKKRIYKEFSGYNNTYIENINFKEINIDYKTKSYTVKEEKEYDFSEIPLVDWEDLSIDDYVVHEDYGIGKYKGINLKETALGKREYITIEYASSSTVYVPVERLDKLTKYVGETNNIKISSLNGTRWKNLKNKVTSEIKERVDQLIKIYSKRNYEEGIVIEGDEELENKFKKTFPFVETFDQDKSIKEICEDLKSIKPMDRLLVGDAGFGKTEVAMRAAFKTVVSGYQVLLLAPTTVLAKQHYESFKERMNDFGVNIELINRYKTPSEKKDISEKLHKGKIDIIIGTHSLLSDKIKIKKLGLIIVDEEQKFGVMQKEKFKENVPGVNFLMMSATPIPRTLYMSLNGLREISTIATPPFGRIPVQTYIGKFTDKMVRTAILREKSRGGQTLYVHNRVNDIEKIYKDLIKIVPEVSVDYAHGRMNKKEFIEKINKFYSGETDVFIATTIIENGIDVPNLNTLIIDDAQLYGISQLYQLKGRVGRSNKRAFSYFLYKNDELKEDTKKRLEAIKKFNEPGSGLKLSLRDLEIRGYGDLLGLDQKGHINNIGLNMYKKILDNALSAAYDQVKSVEKEFAEIRGIKGSMIIPEEYISNSLERMRIYRRIAVSSDIEEMNNLFTEISDRFGKFPEELKDLYVYSQIRIKSSLINIKNIEIGDNNIVITVSENFSGDIKLFEKYARKVIYNNKHNQYLIYGTGDGKNYLKKVFSVKEI